jgi:hypothetical protein
LLSTLAQLHEIRGADLAACRALVAKLYPHYPAYTLLAVTNPDGSLKCSALPPEGTVDYADRDWFQRAVQTRTFTIGSFSGASPASLPCRWRTPS